MKISKFNRKVIFALLISLILNLFIPQTIFSQTEKLGIVNYTPPKGWTKTPKENVVGFSEINQQTGRFCIITLYGATDGTGNPSADFTREWNRFVMTSLKTEANPKTETQIDDGWTATMGGAAAEIDGGKAVAFLTVFTRDRVAVSVLGVFNDQNYMPNLESFIGGLSFDKTIAPAVNPAVTAPQYENGKLVVPLPTFQLTVADLAGEWGEDDKRVSTSYVYRSSGSYAGSDSLAYRSKMTITKNGGYINDFFAIRNGEKIIDKTNGTVTINGRLLSIKQKSTAKYVVRGWLELPEMTVMVICGPWYDDDVIPENIFTNPAQGANLNNTWVRRK